MKFSKHISKFNEEQIKQLINNGYNISQISEIIDIPNRRLGEMLNYFKINIISSRYIKNTNHNYFSKIDSEDKAYILGFLLADGCVSIEPKKRNNEIYSYSKRITFCNSIDDIETISFIKDKICPTAKLKFTQNNKGAKNRKKQVQLRINSSKIVDDLIKMNIKPRKTYDFDFMFDFNNIPKHLIRHFIRGFFDGDGWININQKYYQCVGFVGTSFNFINQLKTLFDEIFNYSSRIDSLKNKNITTYSLNLYLGKDSSEFYNYLYKDSTIYLNRKKIKFLDNTVLTN